MQVCKVKTPESIVKENLSTILNLLNLKLYNYKKDPLIRRRIKEIKNLPEEEQLKQWFNIAAILAMDGRINFPKLKIFKNYDTRVPLERFSNHFLEELVRAIGKLDIDKINKILVLHGYMVIEDHGEFLEIKYPLSDEILFEKYLDKCVDEAKDNYEAIVKILFKRTRKNKDNKDKIEEEHFKFEKIVHCDPKKLLEMDEPRAIEYLCEKYRKEIESILKKHPDTRIYKTSLINDIKKFYESLESYALRKAGLYVPIAYLFVYVSLSFIYNLLLSVLFGLGGLLTIVVGLNNYNKRYEILINEIRRDLGQFVDFL